MMINALNSGARVFMCDFEDACSPTWANMVEGQRNLARRGAPDDLARDAREELHAERASPRRSSCARAAGTSRSGTSRSTASPSRPRSSTSALAFFHNAPELLERGSGPYFYLPKLESHEEARLWARAFAIAEETLGIPCGLDPLHRSDRDDPRGVRDGRDPLRAARLRLRAQRGPVGLHLQHDQEARRRAARPRAGDDDRAVHARLHRAARPLVPRAAGRTRSAAWRRSSRRGATRR